MGRKSSGISPVVATVILVAVAIVIAIAVAFWASGLVGVFTRFEKIEIVSTYWDGEEDAVVVIARNTGSSDAAVDMIFVNGRPCDDWGVIIDDDETDDDETTKPVILAIGKSARFTVSDTCVITGGVTNEIALHTTSGKTYPVAVLVP